MANSCPRDWPLRSLYQRNRSQQFLARYLKCCRLKGRVGKHASEFTRPSENSLPHHPRAARALAREPLPLLSCPCHGPFTTAIIATFQLEFSPRQRAS